MIYDKQFNGCITFENLKRIIDTFRLKITDNEYMSVCEEFDK